MSRGNGLAPGTIPATKSIREMVSLDKSVEGKDHGGSRGVYMANKIVKQLKRVNEGIKVQSHIFEGCGIFVNGNTDPSRNEIKFLVGQHGGVFHEYNNCDTVTHEVCDHYSASSIRNRQLQSPKIVPQRRKEVTVKWLLDSIAARTRLKEDDYYPACLRLTESGAPINTYFKPMMEAPSTSETRVTPAASSTSASATSVARMTVSSPKRRGSSGQKNGHASMTTVEPDFLEYYLQNSRLSYIGSFKRRLLEWSTELGLKRQQQQHEGPFLHGSLFGRVIGTERVVMHVDMDCFFVSVLTRSDPSLNQKPLAVAHSGGSGSSEISSCNYVARRRGIKAGMWMKGALELEPDLQVLEYDFEQYNDVGKILLKIFDQSAPMIEPVSVDEAYLEFPAGQVDSAQELAAELRATIRRETGGCAASVGIGPNKLVARVATARAKPDGIHQIRRAQVKDIFNAMPIAELPGVGRKFVEKLQNHLGDPDRPTYTCGDVINMGLEELKKVDKLGPAKAQSLLDRCRGLDDDPLKGIEPPKSTGMEVAYGVRFSNWDQVRTFMIGSAHALVPRVARQLEQLGRLGKRLTVKLKRRSDGAPVEPSKHLGCGRCDDFSKSREFNPSFSGHKDDLNRLQKEVWLLVNDLRCENEPFQAADLRGIGFTISNWQSVAPSTSSTTAQSAARSAAAFDEVHTEDGTVSRDSRGAKNSVLSSSMPSSSAQSRRQQQVITSFLSPSHYSRQRYEQHREDEMPYCQSRLKKPRTGTNQVIEDDEGLSNSSWSRTEVIDLASSMIDDAGGIQGGVDLSHSEWSNISTESRAAPQRHRGKRCLQQSLHGTCLTEKDIREDRIVRDLYRQQQKQNQKPRQKQKQQCKLSFPTRPGQQQEEQQQGQRGVTAVVDEHPQESPAPSAAPSLQLADTFDDYLAKYGHTHEGATALVGHYRSLSTMELEETLDIPTICFLRDMVKRFVRCGRTIRGTELLHTLRRRDQKRTAASSDELTCIDIATQVVEDELQREALDYYGVALNIESDTTFFHP